MGELSRVEERVAVTHKEMAGVVEIDRDVLEDGENTNEELRAREAVETLVPVKEAEKVAGREGLSEGVGV